MAKVKLSRYEYEPVHKDRHGKLYLTAPIPIKRHLVDFDQVYITGVGETVHSISWKFFQAFKDIEFDVRPSGFFWAIAYANEIVDVTTPIPEGTSVIIPSTLSIQSSWLSPPPFLKRDVVI